MRTTHCLPELQPNTAACGTSAKILGEKSGSLLGVREKKEIQEDAWEETRERTHRARKGRDEQTL